ncbi:MAG TPA: GNAT family N-acetyltransferase [Steroidobacteraceae bacterium]|nr:GNAT family N-acetyltransferase [Steroidobacteraceae bacterium]
MNSSTTGPTAIARPAVPGRYPAELERTWIPAGRPPVCIRALRPTDIELELQLVDDLSPETLHLRLQYSATEVTRRDLERLLDTDYVERLGLGGIVREPSGERLVGVSRYARIEGTTRAECAIVVADAWQGCGLGTELMRTLALAARERGYTRLEGETLAENARLVEWARRFGFDVGTQPHSGGLMRVIIDLEHLPDEP